MSVQASRRTQTELSVSIKALELCEYTIKICNNKNTFDPNNDFNGTIVERIVNESIEIYTLCFEANRIDIRKNSKDYDINLAKRIELQKEAINICNNMLALVSLSQKVFHLELRRVKYWGEKILEVKQLIVSWKDSAIKQ